MILTAADVRRVFLAVAAILAAVALLSGAILAQASWRDRADARCAAAHGWDLEACG